METQLIELSSNRLNSNSNSDSISIDINDDRSSRRIVDDSTLQDLILNDRSLVIFLMFLGFYINDERNSYVVKIIARIWQACLLLFGAIGFCWRTFVYGGHNLVYLFDVMASSSSSTIRVFIRFGFVLHDFIVPLVQVAGLIYGINNVYSRMDRPVTAIIVSPLLASCKRSAIIFFICMTILVIAINPISMTRSWYETEVFTNNNYDDGELSEFGDQTYSLYVFRRFTYSLFFNITVTCYLSVMLLFTTLTMMHINAIQKEVMTIVSTVSNSFELSRYLEAKGKIVSLKNGSYFSIQLLAFTAAVNVIAFLFQLWYLHYSVIKSVSGSNDDDAYVNNYIGMIIYDLSLLPFLLKGN